MNTLRAFEPLHNGISKNSLSWLLIQIPYLTKNSEISVPIHSFHPLDSIISHGKKSRTTGSPNLSCYLYHPLGYSKAMESGRCCSWASFSSSKQTYPAITTVLTSLPMPV